MKYYEVRIKEMIGRFTFVYVAADEEMSEEDLSSLFGCKENLSGIHKVNRISFLNFYAKSKKYRHIKNPLDWERHADCVIKLSS